MKKLISIGVALALLALVVLPIGVAAQPPGCDDIGYTYPTTFSKVPFAIIEAGLHLVGIILEGAGATLGLPEWIDAELMDDIGGFAGGPLAWTVDMMAWGLSLVGMVVAALPPDLGIPAWLSDLVNAIACGLFTPFTCNVTGPAFAPCG